MGNKNVQDTKKWKFDVAITYASEEEGLAEDLHRLLSQNGIDAYFVKHYKPYLLGKHITPVSKYIYGPATTFVVPIISKHYIDKHWPRFEFSVAKEEEKYRGSESILPLQIDDVRLEDLNGDVFYINLRKEGIFSAADVIIQKVREYYEVEKLAAPEEKMPTPKVWVSTFSVVVHELIENNVLPESAPRDHVRLCDWLEKDIAQRISKSSIEKFRVSEPSYRDGESLSVRIAFQWDAEKQPLDFGDIGWWEVLEIAEFQQIYPDQSGEHFLIQLQDKP